jgi:hypothetical protein
MLAVTTSLASSIFPPEALAEAGVGIFTDSKKAPKTLAILLFLGVVVVLPNSLGNAVTSTFGCSVAFFDSGSLTGSALGSIGITEAVSVAKGASSTLSISLGTSVVPMGFGLRIKTLTFFAFGALEDVEAATFLSPLAFERENNNLGKQTQ